MVISTSFCPGEAATSSAKWQWRRLRRNISGCGHGTHVAGSRRQPGALNVGTVSGVAPEADIIAVQVFSEFGQNADCNNSPLRAQFPVTRWWHSSMC
ncbi:MAG: hypothetical protein CM15mP74_17010 [Halieaceae bacterium]|nr:MAG: hypothetical protein CM15mP74_17010 [Halieaceae bacterium]